MKNKVLGLFLFLLFFMLGISGPAYGKELDTVILHPSTEQINLNRSLGIMEDRDHLYTIDDMLALPASTEFDTFERHIPNYGYTSSVYWATFRLMNDTLDQQWLVEISYPPLHSITLFMTDGYRVLETRELGGEFPFGEREVMHRNFTSTIKIPPGGSRILFLRFETDGAMQMPITIWKESAYIKKNQEESLFLGMYYGIAVAMALYNLFLFFSLKQRAYLYYVCFIVLSMFSYLAINGLGFQYIWPDYPWWNTRSIIFFMQIGIIFALLFTKDFLDIPRNLPKYQKAFQYCLYFNLLVVFILFISYKVALNLMVVGMCYMIFIVLCCSYISLKKGVRQARYFFIGWSVFLISVLLSVLADSAYIPLTLFTKYAGQVGSCLEMIFLSFALADRINIIRQEKERAEKEASTSQRLAMEHLKKTDELKDEFLVTTSHELRTPLYGMIGIAEGLQEGVAGPVSKEMNQQLAIMISSGKRLMNVVNDILDFSKLKHNDLALTLQTVQVSEVVDVVLTICHPLVRDKRLSIQNLVNSSLPPIYADPDRLIQILYNLVGNAIKYTEEGQIVIRAVEDQDQLLIMVEDTGQGIPKEKIDLIFDPFHQANLIDFSGIGSSGIGLTITKKLIELQNGEIAVESKVGKGTVFTVSLPLDPEGQRGPGHLPSIDYTSDRRLIERTPKLTNNAAPLARILVADDEPMNLRILSNQLQLKGYEVITACDGEEVIQLVNEEEFDLLILDMMMPKMSGLEVCRKLRKQFSLTELPIIILTAKSQLHDKIISLEVGANDYLMKPCNKDELRARVKTLVHLRSLTKELTSLNRTLEEKVQARTLALKVANEHLEMVNQELLEMEQSRTELLSNISHELGTPITLIQSYLQAVREGFIFSNDERYLDMVHQRLLLLDRLTSDLLELAKLRTNQFNVEFQQIPLNNWIQRVMEQFEIDVTQTGRQFCFQGQAQHNYDSYLVTIDKERMDQVFSNLLKNAMKHTDSVRGKITIRVKLQENPERFQGSEDTFEQNLLIIFEDNGEGIKEEDLPFIFKRYFKKSQKYMREGMGLGLAITQEIIQMHKGDIWVESQLNEGTTFYISLPLFRIDNRKKVTAQ